MYSAHGAQSATKAIGKRHINPREQITRQSKQNAKSCGTMIEKAVAKGASGFRLVAEHVFLIAVGSLIGFCSRFSGLRFKGRGVIHNGTPRPIGKRKGRLTKCLPIPLCVCSNGVTGR